MYGAMRKRAPSSTRLAGASGAAFITAALAVALGSGFGGYIVAVKPDPIVYVPLPDITEDRAPPTPTDLAMSDDALDVPTPLPLDTIFVVEPDTIIGNPDTTPRTEPIVGYPGPTIIPGPAVVRRTAPKLLPGAAPPYPAPDIRQGNEGVTRVDVCVDARGRVSAASLAGSSGHSRLDEAALKWVRNARFTPGAVDGAPQSVCGHTVSYEWKLVNAH